MEQVEQVEQVAQVLDPKAEQRRRRYLGLMGLEAYYARKPLAHAGPSPVFPRVEEETLALGGLAGAKPVQYPDSGATVKAGRNQAEVAAAPGQAAASPAPVSASAPQAEARRKPAVVPPQQPAVVPTRQLFYFRVDSSLAILTQDRWQGEEGAACLDLLRNILRALGLEIDGAGVAIPILHGQAADRTPQEGDSLDVLCRRDGCANLLIFAHNGAELFPEVAPSTTDFSRRIGGVSLRVTVTRGLREMLAFPDLKKHCWKDLQPLRGRLRRISEKPPEQAPQGGE